MNTNGAVPCLLTTWSRSEQMLFLLAGETLWRSRSGGGCFTGNVSQSTANESVLL
ncbi:hypothetical protein NI390_09030 [Vibrio fluvialis]|uniref:hypothetical protein n=1 Tax=Vibrio fluvialis TaxID=676 RepID=UPI0027E5229A|nr:hypothetical protein [Vibrio fluvialis]WMN56900.1 hypothetical protein NI390_09030 [Vibrio fluvialis]